MNSPWGLQIPTTALRVSFIRKEGGLWASIPLGRKMQEKASQNHCRPQMTAGDGEGVRDIWDRNPISAFDIVPEDPDPVPPSSKIGKLI